MNCLTASVWYKEREDLVVDDDRCFAQGMTADIALD